MPLPALPFLHIATGSQTRFRFDGGRAKQNKTKNDRVNHPLKKQNCIFIFNSRSYECSEMFIFNSSYYIDTFFFDEPNLALRHFCVADPKESPGDSLRCGTAG